MNKSVFEKIIDGEFLSHKVYEDENFIAILDINPVQKGHTLLIPKIKALNIMEESDFVKQNILVVATKLAETLRVKLGATGVKFVMNNGVSAGQVVFHTHIHLIPYYDEETAVSNGEEVLAEILG